MLIMFQALLPFAEMLHVILAAFGTPQLSCHISLNTHPFHLIVGSI
jgi:hypothetical protein